MDGLGVSEGKGEEVPRGRGIQGGTQGQGYIGRYIGMYWASLGGGGAQGQGYMEEVPSGRGIWRRCLGVGVYGGGAQGQGYRGRGIQGDTQGQGYIGRYIGMYWACLRERGGGAQGQGYMEEQGQGQQGQGQIPRGRGISILWIMLSLVNLPLRQSL